MLRDKLLALILVTLLLVTPIVSAQQNLNNGETISVDGATIKLISFREVGAFERFLNSLFGGEQLISYTTPSGPGVGKTYHITVNTKVDQQPGRAILYVSKGTQSITSLSLPVPTCTSSPCTISGSFDISFTSSGSYLLALQVLDVTKSFEIPNIDGSNELLTISVPSTTTTTTTPTTTSTNCGQYSNQFTCANDPACKWQLGATSLDPGKCISRTTATTTTPTAEIGSASIVSVKLATGLTEFKKGDSIPTKITLKNTGVSSNRFIVSPRVFDQDGNLRGGGGEEITIGAGKTEVITLAIEVVTLQPGNYRLAALIADTDAPSTIIAKTTSGDAFKIVSATTTAQQIGGTCEVFTSQEVCPSGIGEGCIWDFSNSKCLSFVTTSGCPLGTKLDTSSNVCIPIEVSTTALECNKHSNQFTCANDPACRWILGASFLDPGACVSRSGATTPTPTTATPTTSAISGCEVYNPDKLACLSATDSIGNPCVYSDTAKVCRPGTQAEKQQQLSKVGISPTGVTDTGNVVSQTLFGISDAIGGIFGGISAVLDFFSSIVNAIGGTGRLVFLITIVIFALLALFAVAWVFRFFKGISGGIFGGRR